MADFTIKHRRQACPPCQAMVADQVVCMKLCSFFINPEMMRFLGWGCITSDIKIGFYAKLDLIVNRIDGARDKIKGVSAVDTLGWRRCFIQRKIDQVLDFPAYGFGELIINNRWRFHVDMPVIFGR
ncbi:hypothetical protein GO003_010915 [Methylicorpusculum oleiharenae]|uniref:hypothetical protein n=1 Tax=Methylicorpusculum oleiharenae TaxID=1338687 RepID=UPI00135897BD|nr:hypothetical protein [Methylicorpusculum oleiharenae]MCD2450903.1 hypothetical protein [Methylicorpusculum oleiharenae]